MRIKILLLMLLFLCVGMTATAQNPTVTGKVTDAQGEPLVGATVKVDGTKNATVTDIDGLFSIAAKKSEKLTVSYIGYQSRSVTIDRI